jgi:SAM-dependent methyltransferase
MLTRSRHLSFHARGEAAFVWHGLTGDVSEMSADIVQLLLAFDEPRDVEEVAQARTAGLDPVDARNFATILQRRGYLVEPGTDEVQALVTWHPAVPRGAVFERDGDDVLVCTRTQTIPLHGALAAAFLSCDGKRRLKDVLRGRKELAPELLRLCRADCAALKVLPVEAAVGGPQWAESTMPFPEVDPYTWKPVPLDLRAYHEADIVDAEQQFEERETTLSHLLRLPHEALSGRTFGQALAQALTTEGVAAGPRVVEIGGGTGILGEALREALGARAYSVVDLAPVLAKAQVRRGLAAVRGDARRLPVASGCADLVVSNEMAGDLGPDMEGPKALVGEAARVLAPGGWLYLSEFGSAAAKPVRSDHLDHDEVSIRFEDLRAEAERLGLRARLVHLPALLGLKGEVESLVTTRHSFAALRRLFLAHGAQLDKRAWTREGLARAAEQAGIKLDRVHGLLWAPAGERLMGLRPFEFMAVVATRPLLN